MIRHANLKYKSGSRNIWYRGYYADIVGKNEKTSQEHNGPFTGRKNGTVNTFENLCPLIFKCINCWV